MQTRFVAWAALCGLSFVISAGLDFLRLPGALLIGPMVSAIILSVAGWIRLELPSFVFLGAQAVIGCMVAGAITLALFDTLVTNGLAMALAVAVTVLAGGIVGYVLVRFGRLSGSTAAWGSSPGAASVMIPMSRDFGADMRLVAFMQYLRLLTVVATASLVARWLGVSTLVAEPASTFDFGLRWSAVETVAIGIAGVVLGRYPRIPGGAILMPMLLATVLHLGGFMPIDLPHWLLVLAYILIGWYIGLAFDRPIVIHALRAVPQLLMGTVLLIGLCAASAWLLARFSHMDGLTAYLATTPGGLDSVAIIAASSHADMGFVLGVQTLRFIAVLVSGPLIARLLSRISE